MQPRFPTVDSLMKALDDVAPGFRAYYESDENLYDSGTFHSAFAALSIFVRESNMDAEVWPNLASLLNEVVDGSDSELDNAAATCFIENLASRDHPLKPFLRGEALDYWSLWEV